MLCRQTLRGTLLFAHQLKSKISICLTASFASTLNTLTKRNWLGNLGEQIYGVAFFKNGDCSVGTVLSVLLELIVLGCLF